MHLFILFNSHKDCLGEIKHGLDSFRVASVFLWIKICKWLLGCWIDL